MKKLFAMAALVSAFTLQAQQVSTTWVLNDPDNLSATVVTGDDAYTCFQSSTFTKGAEISKVETMTKSTAADGYTLVEYDPAFTTYFVSTKKTAKTSGHCVSAKIYTQSGHTFKPTKISFDAAKVGTDGGNLGLYVKEAGGSEKVIDAAIAPTRNKIQSGSALGYSHHEYTISDVLLDGQSYEVIIYFYNINGVDNSSPKALALRNLTVEGAVDEAIYDASHYISSMTCSDGQGGTLDLTSGIASLKTGETYPYPTVLAGHPDDFNIVCTEGYTSSLTMDGNTATVTIYADAAEVFQFKVRFTVHIIPEKGAAKPLNRGLMALSLDGAAMGNGNLVSWRHRATDDQGTKYKLYRCYSPEEEGTVLNNNLYIIDRTNFLDDNGTADCYYRLEVCDKYGAVTETETSPKTWDKMTFEIPVTAPVDTRFGALYNPNDASFCDMDGDGEYEIILKWSPSNEKDANKTGDTSNPIFDCLKLDGTHLWRIDLGPNFFTSAHTIQFIAWDFDGDGYGEFMCKTAPGTVDGQGNFVVIGDDDPYANLLGSNGKQTSGPEYITVFDGMTGVALATIPYHTDYAAGASYWGDENQNRSERYLAALAYLDGPDANPSPIFARGYYKGAFVGAYDWDGTTLKTRWVSRNTTSGKGLWGEGAHWISVGDCDGDSRQEIVYGSAALDHDGSLLYRTGLGHGDALHLGDFLTERPGLEVFMVHEESPYGYDLRDAATGTFILRETADGDTGRGLAAHFDSTQPSAQFMYSSSPSLFNLDDGSVNGETWAIGQSGAGINNRMYWDGDLYDEFFDKSIIAHWDPENKWFSRFKVNNTNYTSGKLNNSTKYNPCVLGDLLGDWREEIVTHNGSDTASATALIINATNITTDYRLPHLMDDPQYRVQVVNQNCAYNQPPHLSFDPAVVYAGNPNVAMQENEMSGIDNCIVNADNAEDTIYNLQGIRVDHVSAPGIYIVNGRKVVIK